MKKTKKTSENTEKVVREVIGRMACPACGEPNQNLKVNKNGNLYVYCDNRCSIRLNPKESREIADELRQGHVVSWRGFDIRPAGVPVLAKQEKQTTEVKENDRKQRGNTTDGRADARPSDPAGGNEQPKRRTFAEWLWSDDDIA